MNIKLVKLTNEYKEKLFEMMDEWTSYDEKIIPTSIAVNDYHSFDYYMNNLCRDKEINGIVPETTYFCLDIDRNIFVGAVTIRHYLTEKLSQNGGHIGDGIRPSERRKGYATAMIELALQEAKKLGINKVLMCCEKQNIASAKSIMNNGGILETDYVFDGIVKQRYWIDNEVSIMDENLRNFIIEKTHDMLSVDCCCQEAKKVANMWLSSIGTDKEIQATKDYIAGLEENIMPIDGLIAFAESERCAKIFGDKQQDEIAHAYKLKSDGVKYCDCPACKAVETVLERKDEILDSMCNK